MELQATSQSIGSTLCTIHKKLKAPARSRAKTPAKAQKNSPVWWTIHPVIHGAATPARFPKAFCIPVHLPAARGPAIVCVTAHKFEEKRPKPRQATINSDIDSN